MVKVSLTEANVQRSGTKSDLTEDYADSIETIEEPRAEALKKPPIPRPRTSKVKDSLAKLYDTNADKNSVDKTSSLSDQYDTSNFTMKSEPKSYKDNIKSRFRQIKSNSSKSLLKAAQRRSDGHEKSETISFGLLREESKLVEDKLRNKENYEIENIVTNSEKIAFFCQIEQLNENFEEMQVKNDTRENAVVFSKADDLSALLENAENANVQVLNGFTSSMAENGALSKLKQDGIYKPDLPNSRKFYINLLEKRLVDSEIRDWFGSDGRLKLLDKPNRFSKLKPVITAANFAQTIYSLPILDSCIPEAEEIVIIGKSTIIDINFKSIRFSHHPLFSAEHILQEKILNYYDIYREFVVSNRQERVFKKLDTMRKKFKNTLKNSEDGSGDMKPSDQNLSTIKEDVAILREKLFQDSKRYRDNMKSILATWKNIKKIRDKNDYSNTGIKLIIRKEVLSIEEDDYNWNEHLHIVCRELQEENELTNSLNRKEYKRELRKLKNDHPDGDLPLDFVKPENEIVDYEKLKEIVTKRFKESFRWPGEPILNFSLSYENEISNTIENAQEKLRRAAIETAKINLKINCNNMQVCSTKCTNLNDNFTLLIEDAVSIKPDVLPDFLTIEICEQNENMPSKLIGSLVLNLSTFQNCGKVYEKIFTSKNIVHYKHEGVGSGESNIMGKIIKKYELHNNFEVDTNLELCGILNYTLKIDNLRERAKDNVDDIMEDNFMGGIVDPENPRNFFKDIEELKFGEHKENNLNRLWQTLEEPHFLCSPDDLQNNLRFKLLELRERNEPEFTGMIIPNRIKEIPSNVLVSYNRRISQEQHQIIDEPDIDESRANKIVARRSLGRKQLRQVYVKIFQQCKNRENCLLYEHVVDEKSVPQIQLILKTIILNFFNWFKLQPKLSKPIPKIAFNKTAHQLEDTADVSNSIIPKIKIHLISGSNFPNRKVDTTRENSDATSSKSSVKASGIIKPFIEISINNLTIESNVAEGGNPVWNEVLVIPIESSSTDYLGPNSLSGSVIFNIFDSIEEPEVATATTIKKVVKWLGFIQLPISAISSSTKMEGLFPVKETVLIDYEYPNPSNLTRSPGTTPFQKFQNTMYIQMSIGMEPHVPKLSPDFDNTPCNEPPFLKNHLTIWNNDFNNSHTERKFSVFVLDTAGRSSCITRYIRSLEPPQINRHGFDVTSAQCAKYIAMIPFTETNKFYENIWLNTEQLLKYQIGSITDHAIALTCYLLALNLDVWLVLAGGVPHGNTVAYVLEREHTGGVEIPTHYVYDITTGHKYNVLDTMCPLQKIYCVVNEFNVWANIQRETDINVTCFDFSRRFDWLPLFGNQVSAPTNSVQMRLVYTYTYDVVQLEATIEAKLRKKITNARRLVRTVWNHSACRIVKDALNRFEISYMHGRKQSGYGQNSEFKTTCRNHRLKGFILNIPFDRISTVIDIVQTTRIFDENNTNELVMAVSIQPYPNNILNLWLALCYSL